LLARETWGSPRLPVCQPCVGSTARHGAAWCGTAAVPPLALAGKLPGGVAVFLARLRGCSAAAAGVVVTAVAGGGWGRGKCHAAMLGLCKLPGPAAL
jgi:hypothetical protein